jgi:hypothetical protein
VTGFTTIPSMAAIFGLVYLYFVTACFGLIRPSSSDIKLQQNCQITQQIRCLVGLYDCEMLRIPHCLDSRLTDGGKVVSLTHGPRSTQKHYFSAADTHFCWKLSRPQGLMWPEGSGKLKKCINFIGSRTRDLPVCHILP